MRGLGIALSLGLAALPLRAETQLVMVEQPGCHWCAEWNAAIGPIYPKTPEGRTAPLRRIQLREAVPDDLSFASRPVFTPTFILTDDGQELGRIEGYPGEDMFWWMLARLLADHDVDVSKSAP